MASGLEWWLLEDTLSIPPYPILEQGQGPRHPVPSRVRLAPASGVVVTSRVAALRDFARLNQTGVSDNADSRDVRNT